MLRHVEPRPEGLEAGRAKRLELLRGLWRQAMDLRAAANDPGREGPATGRLLALCAEITRECAGTGGDPTGAIGDAPTIERS